MQLMHQPFTAVSSLLTSVFLELMTSSYVVQLNIAYFASILSPTRWRCNINCSSLLTNSLITKSMNMQRSITTFVRLKNVVKLCEFCAFGPLKTTWLSSLAPYFVSTRISSVNFADVVFRKAVMFNNMKPQRNIIYTKHIVKIQIVIHGKINYKNIPNSLRREIGDSINCKKLALPHFYRVLNETLIHTSSFSFALLSKGKKKQQNKQTFTKLINNPLARANTEPNLIKYLFIRAAFYHCNAGNSSVCGHASQIMEKKAPINFALRC